MKNAFIMICILSLVLLSTCDKSIDNNVILPNGSIASSANPPTDSFPENLTAPNANCYCPAPAAGERYAQGLGCRYVNDTLLYNNLYKRLACAENVFVARIEEIVEDGYVYKIITSGESNIKGVITSSVYSRLFKKIGYDGWFFNYTGSFPAFALYKGAVGVFITNKAGKGPAQFVHNFLLVDQSGGIIIYPDLGDQYKISSYSDFISKYGEALEPGSADKYNDCIGCIIPDNGEGWYKNRENWEERCNKY